MCKIIYKPKLLDVKADTTNRQNTCYRNKPLEERKSHKKNGYGMKWSNKRKSRKLKWFGQLVENGKKDVASEVNREER